VTPSGSGTDDPTREVRTTYRVGESKSPANWAGEVCRIR